MHFQNRIIKIPKLIFNVTIWLYCLNVVDAEDEFHSEIREIISQWAQTLKEIQTAEEAVAVIGVAARIPPSISTVGVAAIALLNVAEIIVESDEPNKLSESLDNRESSVGGETEIASSDISLATSSKESKGDAA